ncbi:unnamed protein product, partial [Mesorhabditis spiculigera]
MSTDNSASVLRTPELQRSQSPSSQAHAQFGAQFQFLAQSQQPQDLSRTSVLSCSAPTTSAIRIQAPGHQNLGQPMAGSPASPASTTSTSSSASHSGTISTASSVAQISPVYQPGSAPGSAFRRPIPQRLQQIPQYGQMPQQLPGYQPMQNPVSYFGRIFGDIAPPVAEL